MELVDIEPCPDPLFRVLDHLVPHVVDAHVEPEVLHAAPQVFDVVDHKPLLGLNIGPVGKRGE